MSNPTLQFYLSPEAIKQGLKFAGPRAGDAGFDLACLADVTIAPGAREAIRTGVHLAIPHGYVGLVRDRSSVASRGGATVAGVIDASYRGEVKVLMYNLSSDALTFKTGDRVAQLVVIAHLPGDACVEAKSLDALGDTERGEGGFGSTGR